MNAEDPLIPRPYLRLAVALGIVIALTGGGIWVGNYALTVMRQQHHDIVMQAQTAALQSQREAEERAARAHQTWLAETVTVTLQNHTAGEEALWTATAAGTNADGSTMWTYNEACSAAAWQSCSTQVYDHRGIMIHGAGPYSASNPNWAWQAVQTSDMTLTAIPVNP